MEKASRTVFHRRLKQTAPEGSIPLTHGGKEFLSVRMLRRSEQFARSLLLHNSALVHHRNFVGKLGNQTQIVRNMQIAERVGDLEFPEQFQNQSLIQASRFDRTSSRINTLGLSAIARAIASR